MHVGIAEIVVQETQGSKTSCMHIVYNCQDPKLAASSSQHTQMKKCKRGGGMTRAGLGKGKGLCLATIRFF